MSEEISSPQVELKRIKNQIDILKLELSEVNDSDSNTETTTATQEAPVVEEVTNESAKECPASPTGDHDVFHNEGTDEKYCKYCGKTD